jgi:hypothetical protein
VTGTGALGGGGDLSTNRTITVNAHGIDGTYLRQSAGLSVVGNATNGTADVADITATTLGHVLTVLAGPTLGWAAPAASGANALGTYIVQTSTNAPANAQILGALGTGLLKNATATGVLSIATAGSDYENPLTFSSGVTRSTDAISVTTNGITNSMIRQGVARSVIGVTGNATANVADIQGTADQVLVVNGAGTALAFSTVATGGIAASAVTYAKIQDAAAGLSVLARSANTSGVYGEVTGTANQVLRVSGTTLGFGSVTGAMLSGFTTNTLPIGSSGTLVDSTLTLVSNALTHAASSSGADVGLLVSNSSNSASATASIEARVAGGTADNPRLSVGITGGKTWHFLANNATSDQLEIRDSSTARLMVGVDGLAVNQGVLSGYHLLVRPAVSTASTKALVFSGTASTSTAKIGVESNAGPIGWLESNGTGTTSTNCGINNANMLAIYLDSAIAGSAMLVGAQSNVPLYLASNGVARVVLTAAGNIGLFPTITSGADASTYGSGVGVQFIANATTDPTTNPTGGGLLFVSSGALKYRGSSGNVTTVAIA